ncbi:hypothetical protein GJ496_001114 [Pomphorhynchus laevis]|nr:hypothetical protein GJ496_001114 [Pomphorhynchus laevis]
MKDNNVAYYCAICFGGAAIGLTALACPFVLPAFRRYALPFIPATKEQINSVFYLLSKHRGPMRSVIDLGSGDGRMVFEATRFGFQNCCGVELNHWLVWYCRLKNFYLRSNCRFYRQNLLQINLSGYDCITVFGTEEIMPVILAKLKKEVHSDCRIVTSRFKFPDNIKYEDEQKNICSSTWIYYGRNLRDTK